MNIDRLLRESNPPSGQLASPGPQYLNPETGQPEVVQGRYGAPFAMLLGPDGHPISNSNRLPVADQAAVDKLEQVRALLGDTDFATQATLAQVLTRLEAIEEQLETGDAKVQLKGSRVEQTVIAREVRQAGVTPRVAATPPTGTIGALIEHRIWGMTGTFAQDQGARLEIGLMKTYGVATSGPWHVRRTGWTRLPSAAAQQVILLYPGVTLSEADNEAAQKAGSLYLPVRPLVPIRLTIEIAGTFNAGEGVDSEVVIMWFVGV